MLDLIRLFTLSVETGSFSEAGRRLGLQPSSVSRRISELETVLSARLLNRTTRRLSLTEAGQIYYSRVRSIVEQIDEAAIAISQTQSSPRGNLRLTLPGAFGRLIVAPILVEFADAYPEVRLDVILTDEILDLVKHNIDVAIRIMPPDDTQLIGKRIAPAPRVLCASTSYLHRFGIPEGPDDLQLHRLIAYRRSEGHSSWSLRNRDGRNQISLNAVLTADDDDILYQATIRGLGISIQPFWRVSEDFASGRLARVLEGFEATSSKFDTAVYILYLERTALPPKIRSFVDFVHERLERQVGGFADGLQNRAALD